MANAWGSLPLLCPETWLPSALSTGSRRETGRAIRRAAYSVTFIHEIFSPPVVLFVHQVVPSPEGHQVGVVGRCWDGDGARAADVGVAQLVGEKLEIICSETVVIPQNVVVGGTTRTLEEGEES